MDQSSNQAIGKGKNLNIRRSWTKREEEVLIAALKELVISGWRTNNGFRAGYLIQLEQSMLQSFPSTDLKAMPHIHSKIHVWKKDCCSIQTMLSRSGVGWNNATKMIEVEDSTWETYTDPNAQLMRFKSWPYYEDWIEIFGTHM